MSAVLQDFRRETVNQQSATSSSDLVHRAFGSVCSMGILQLSSSCDENSFFYSATSKEVTTVSGPDDRESANSDNEGCVATLQLSISDDENDSKEVTSRADHTEPANSDSDFTVREFGSVCSMGTLQLSNNLEEDSFFHQSVTGNEATTTTTGPEKAVSRLDIHALENNTGSKSGTNLRTLFTDNNIEMTAKLQTEQDGKIGSAATNEGSVSCQTEENRRHGSEEHDDECEESSLAERTLLPSVETFAPGSKDYGREEDARTSAPSVISAAGTSTTTTTPINSRSTASRRRCFAILCPKCHVQFPSHVSCERHALAQHGRLSFKCNECQYKSNRVSNVESHKRMKHSTK